MALLALTSPSMADVVQAPARSVVLPDGRNLAMRCQGTGQPTVVLDSGLGLDSTIWSRVQPRVADSTRVCSFDRPGYGDSHAGPEPRTAARIVEDLRAALQAIDITGPYLLVGHSMGGLSMRYYASVYRREVSGMVLVDPSIDGNDAQLKSASPAFTRDQAEMDAKAGKCIRATAEGRMTPSEPVYAECGSPPVGGPMTSPIRARTVLSEQSALDISDQQVQARETGYGDLPLIILTAGNQFGGSSQWPEGEAAALQRVWREGHAKIAARSERGENRIVDGASHVIQMSKPDAVVSAVEDMLATLRK